MTPIQKAKEIADSFYTYRLGNPNLPHDHVMAAWLESESLAALLSGEDWKEDVLMCNQCGGKLVYIRGRYPKQEKRCVCPTCDHERLEQINEISSREYGVAYKNPHTSLYKP